MRQQALMILPMGACLVVSLLAIFLSRKGSVGQRRLVTLAVTGLAVIGVLLLPENLRPFAKGTAAGGIGSFLLAMMTDSHFGR